MFFGPQKRSEVVQSQFCIINMMGQMLKCRLCQGRQALERSIRPVDPSRGGIGFPFHRCKTAGSCTPKQFGRLQENGISTLEQHGVEHRLKGHHLLSSVQGQKRWAISEECQKYHGQLHGEGGKIIWKSHGQNWYGRFGIDMEPSARVMDTTSFMTRWS